ncbi:MAG: hypothetical protein U5K54_18475 [Cytophagales bacterium]|nr:hypothetical protein [Cytophagales bacterium]
MCLHTEDRKAAVNECIRLQKQSPYSDTWMYSGLLGENPQVVKINEAERKEAMEQLAVAEVLEAAPKEGMEEKVEAEVKNEEEIVIAKEMKPEPAVGKDPDTKSFYFGLPH